MTDTVTEYPTMGADWSISVYENDREVRVCGSSRRHAQPGNRGIDVLYQKLDNDSLTHRNRVTAMLHVVRDLLANEHDGLWSVAETTTTTVQSRHLDLTVEGGGLVVIAKGVKKTEKTGEGAVV